MYVFIPAMAEGGMYCGGARRNKLGKNLVALYGGERAKSRRVIAQSMTFGGAVDVPPNTHMAQRRDATIRMA